MDLATLASSPARETSARSGTHDASRTLMNESWLVRCGATTMLAVALTSVGCVSVARRAFVCDVVKPELVATQPALLAMQPSPLEIGAAVEPSLVAPTPPVVVVAAPAPPPPPPPPPAIVTSDAHEVLTSLGFEILDETHQPWPTAGEAAEVDVTIGRRGDLTEMSYVFTLADDATAARYARALGSLGMHGLSAQRGRIVYWVFTTCDDVGWSEAILARLAGESRG